MLGYDNSWYERKSSRHISHQFTTRWAMRSNLKWCYLRVCSPLFHDIWALTTRSTKLHYLLTTSRRRSSGSFENGLDHRRGTGEATKVSTNQLAVHFFSKFSDDSNSNSSCLAALEQTLSHWSGFEVITWSQSHEVDTPRITERVQGPILQLAFEPNLSLCSGIAIS